MKVDDFKKWAAENNVSHLFRYSKRVVKIGKLEIFKQEGKFRFFVDWNS